MTVFFSQLINGLSLGSIYALIALGYDAATTVLYGIQAAEDAGLEAGSDEYKQAVIDAIAGGTIEGLTGTFTFDEHHDPVKSTAILTYIDGKPELKEMF